MFKHAQRICVVTLAVTGLFARTAPPGETKTTEAILIAYGQTGRFNVLNRGASAPATVVACSAILTYYDGKGAMLKQSTVTVLRGQICSLDLFSDVDLALPAAQRKQTRAEFSMPLSVPPPTSTGTGTGGTTTAPSPACPLIGTLEIFDTLAGKTEVVLSATDLIPPIAATSTTGQ